MSEAEDAGERLGLIGSRVFALRRRRQGIEPEHVSGKINCDQIMLEDVGSDQPVSVTHDVFFRNADNAIVELEFANYNLVHPGRVAAGRSGVSYTFERMFSEPPRSNFFRELLPDGHAGSAGIKQESLYRRVIELYAQTNTSRDQDRKSTRLNSSHQIISYAVFCLKKKKDALIDILLRANRVG